MAFNTPDDYDRHWRKCELCKQNYHPAGEGNCTCSSEDLEAFYVERTEERSRARYLFGVDNIQANSPEND